MRYRVLQPLHVPAGTVLDLSAAQRASRRPWLQEVADGLVQATGPLQFKAGEELGIEGAYPQAVPAVLQPLDPVPAPQLAVDAPADPAPVRRPPARPRAARNKPAAD